MEDFNEIYKIHIGVYQSDNDSLSSLDESLKPLPYTAEEIRSNLIIVNPEHIGSEESVGHRKYNSRIFDQQSIAVLDKQRTFPNISSGAQENSEYKKHRDYQNNSSRNIGAKPTQIKKQHEKKFRSHNKVSRNLLNSIPNGSNPPVPNKGNSVKSKLFWPQELKKLILEDQCKLCNVSGNNLQDHYNSYNHKNTVELWLKNYYFSQVVFSPHWPAELNKLIEPNICRLCNANLLSPSVLKSHYESNRHKNNVNQWLLNYNARREKPKISSQQPVQSLIYKNTKEHCYICNVDFDERTEHQRSAMHIQIHNFVVLLISGGGSVQASWIKIFKNQITENYCVICRIQLKSDEQSILHFSENSHIAGLKFWILRNIERNAQNLVDQIDTKWCYCRICQQILDGTTCAEHHYKTEQHKQNEQYSSSVRKVERSDPGTYQNYGTRAASQSLSNTVQVDVQTLNDLHSVTSKQEQYSTNPNTFKENKSESKDNTQDTLVQEQVSVNSREQRNTLHEGDDIQEIEYNAIELNETNNRCLDCCICL